MFKEIATFRFLWEAEVANTLLRSCGLNPMEIDTSSHCSIAGADQWYYVRVPESEVMQAADVLRDNGHEKRLI